MVEGGRHRDAPIIMVVLMVLVHLVVVWVQLIMHLMVECWRLQLHKVVCRQRRA